MKLPDIVCYYGLIVRDGVQGVTIGAIYRRCQIGYGYDEYIAQVMNYKFWIQIKIVKNSAAMTQQLIKDSKFIVQAKNSITYGDALFTASILLQITLKLISVVMIQVGQQILMVRWGMG